MEPIRFKEVNVTFAKDQPDYLPLPAHKTKDGVVTTCWKMTFREKIKLFFTGRLYLQVQTFNKPFSPIVVFLDDPFLEE